jgi:hypothetical protein
MAFDVINVGTAVNDGTGDTLRSAGQKINANFAIAVEKTADDGAALLPVGDDSERPTPAVGMLRFNTDSSGFEGYDGSAWGSLGAAAGYAFAGTVVYTTTGSFDKTDPLGTGDIGLRAIRVRLVGGGGGGGGVATTGGSQAAGGGGGGGGAYGESFITNIAGLSTPVTVTVGAAGAAGAAGNNNGGAGGTSSFGALVSATGGSGGSGQAATATPTIGASGGLGGNTVTADLAIYGQSGSLAVLFANVVASAAGGSSVFGAGGSSIRDSSGVAGGNVVGFGSGGSGAANAASQGVAEPGGAGRAGIAFVDCFV